MVVVLAQKSDKQYKIDVDMTKLTKAMLTESTPSQQKNYIKRLGENDFARTISYAYSVLGGYGKQNAKYPIAEVDFLIEFEVK